MATWLGTTIGVHQVRAAIESVLRDWLPVAVVDQTRQSGLDPTDPTVLELPASWERASDYLNLPQDQSPNIVVASPRTSGRHVRAGRHYGRTAGVDWLCHVAAVCRGVTYESTATMVGIYMAAIAAIVDQQLSRHDLVNTVAIDGDGEQYDVLDMQDARTIAGGVLRFHVGVSQARQLHRRYDTPPADPFDPAPDLPVVEDTDITIRQENT